MKYLFILTIALGTIVACAPKTTEVITDSADQAATTHNDATAPSDADLSAGKNVFSSKCISCHYGRDAGRIPELVDSFSKERWDEILPEMIENAELNEMEKENLTTYIYWELSN